MKSAIIAVGVVLLVSAAPASADDDADTSLNDIPHITMVGAARTEVVPDIATISLGVTTESPSAADAANENARKAQQVIDAAKALGVSANDIATQSLTLHQVFDQVRDLHGWTTGQKSRGFSADNIVAVRVHDLAKAGTLAEAMIAKGANHLNGISFAVENPDPIVEKLKGEAVKNAKVLAQSAAQAAGARLGRVLLIRAPYAGGGLPRPNSLSTVRAAPASIPIEAGTTNFDTSVEVTWALESGR